METLLALLPLTLLILIILGAIWLVRRKHGKEGPGPQGQVPYGVHGALAFFIYASLTFGVMLTLGRTSLNLKAVEEASPAILGMPAWSTYKLLTWLTTLAYIGLMAFVVLRLRNRFVPQSVRDVRLFLLLAPGALLLADLLSVQVLPFRAQLAPLVVSLIQAMFVNSVWLAYFHYSKRVRNTYYPVQSVSGGGVASVTAHPPGPHPAAEKDEDSFGWRQSPPVESVQPAAASSPPTAAAANTAALEERLATLKHLREQGLISADDYERKKTELLDSL